MIYFHHPDCRQHHTPPGHPERVDRVASLEAAIQDHAVNSRLRWREAPEASPEDLLRVHSREYLEFLEARCAEASWYEPVRLDSGDTWAVADSFRIARLGAGAGCGAVDALYSGEVDRAFVGMRPPGHHARPGAPMGFCLLGNVAVAARYAQHHFGVERVFILDWDVHHGNGTQEIFYEDPSVFFCSFHQSPHWPFSGHASETGEGPGRGATLNVPMPAGSRLPDYESRFCEQLVPAVERFQPDLLILSAGFDAHTDDPLGDIDLEAGDFGVLTRMVRNLAEHHCQGRILSFLEGGYDLSGLQQSVIAHLEILAQ